MDFIAYEKGKVIGNIRIYSIGGGAIKIKGESEKDISPVELYNEINTKQILSACHENKMTLLQYIKKHEGDDFWQHLDKV
jgi:hypothetical protein